MSQSRQTKLISLLLALIATLTPTSSYSSDEAYLNDIITSLDNLQKISINITAHSPTDGVDNNNLFEANYLYTVKDKVAIKKAIEIFKDSSIKSVSYDESFLYYVNTVFDFELANKKTLRLLISPYLLNENRVDAEIHGYGNKILYLTMDKSIHKAILAWIANYAKVNEDSLRSNEQKFCDWSYQNALDAALKEEALGRSLSLDNLLKRSPKESFCRLSDAEDESINRSIRYIERDYFLKNSSQQCNSDVFYRTDPEYCKSGWVPSFNKWATQ